MWIVAVTGPMPGGQVCTLHHQTVSEGQEHQDGAEEVKVLQRHIQRLWAEYLKTGTAQGRRSLGCRGGDGAGRPPPLARRGAVDHQETPESRMQYRVYRILKSKRLGNLHVSWTTINGAFYGARYITVGRPGVAESATVRINATRASVEDLRAELVWLALFWCCATPPRIRPGLTCRMLPGWTSSATGRCACRTATGGGWQRRASLLEPGDQLQRRRDGDCLGGIGAYRPRHNRYHRQLP